MCKRSLFHLISFLAMIADGCNRLNPTDPPVSEMPRDNTVHTFVLQSPEDPRLPPPLIEDIGATDAERLMVKSVVADISVVMLPSGDPSTLWDTVTSSLGSMHFLRPPEFARAYALVHAAIYDALLAGHVRNRHDLVDNATAAGAGATVLRYLFPEDSSLIMAQVPSQLLVPHGLALGRVLRSWVLGRVVGELAALRGRGDGSDAVFDGTIPAGPGIWNGMDPVLPMCGTWKTWITSSGSEFQPETPYAFGSHDDSVEVQTVFEISHHRTPEQVAAVHKWADRSPATIWNSYLYDRVQRYGLTAIRSARAYAYLNAAVYDAFVSCWRTKYTYWAARPFQRIPGLVTVIPTPNFPSYTSGHSTISAAAADVLGEIFPGERTMFSSEAEEAALSRLWGGIHFPHDNAQGLVVGHLIGRKVLSLMRDDRSGVLLPSF